MNYLKLRAVKLYFPFGVAELICAFSAPTYAPYDSWALWQEVPEYDMHGDYGQLPMCPVDMPLFS